MKVWEKRMKIEKRYFDLYKSECNKFVEEVRQTKENLTKAEREIEKKKMKEELQRIHHKYEEHIHNWKTVPNEEKLQQFETISLQALHMAKYICCNIIIEEEKNILGKIILEAECFILPSQENRIDNKVISNLFLAADDAFIDNTSSGLCKMEFWFQLYKEIPAG